MVMVLVNSSSLIAANKTKVYEMFKYVSADCTPAFFYQLCLMRQLPFLGSAVLSVVLYAPFPHSLLTLNCPFVPTSLPSHTSPPLPSHSPLSLPLLFPDLHLPLLLLSSPPLPSPPVPSPPPPSLMDPPSTRQWRCTTGKRPLCATTLDTAHRGEFTSVRGEERSPCALHKCLTRLHCIARGV